MTRSGTKRPRMLSRKSPGTRMSAAAAGALQDRERPEDDWMRGGVLRTNHEGERQVADEPVHRQAHNVVIRPSRVGATMSWPRSAGGPAG